MARHAVRTRTSLFILAALASVTPACVETSDDGGSRAAAFALGGKASIPGRVEAESYREGGEGVGYHDTTPGNLGGACRDDAVDEKQSVDSAGGNCVVGWFDTGEWLAYDVNVSRSGTYDVDLRVARGIEGSGVTHLEVDGHDVTGPVAVPSTGAWDAFTDVSKTGVSLPAGEHTLRLVNDGDYYDIDWLSFTLSNDATASSSSMADGGAISVGAGAESGAASGCGDGVVQADEACDDGPCCDATCHFIVPTGAVEVKPGDDLASVVAAHDPGTTYCVRAGEYRMQGVSPHDADSFHGERGATMNGARLLSPVQEGSYWVQHGIAEHGQMGGECETGYPGCVYPEDLFLDDVPLVHVTSLDQVTSGTYFLDYDAQTLYLADDPTGKRAELSSTRGAFEPTGAYVRVRGFVIEKYAIPAQMGAIGDQYPKDGWEVEQNDLRFNHGAGINVTNGGVMRHNQVHHNGQKGVGASGAGCLVESNEIAFNNYAHYSWGWEGGGSKFSNTTNLVVRGNFVHDNYGPGLWTDINNTGTLYELNIVERNVWAGIFHEISFACTIRNNIVKRNGLETKDSWIWGGQIQISTSQDCDVYGNDVVVGVEGGTAIVVLEQNRGGSYASRNNHVHDNEINFLGENGKSGLVQDFGDEAVYTSNSFDANRYHMPDTHAARFTWNDQWLTWASFLAAGQEATGTIDTNVTP